MLSFQVLSQWMCWWRADLVFSDNYTWIAASDYFKLPPPAPHSSSADGSWFPPHPSHHHHPKQREKSAGIKDSVKEFSSCERIPKPPTTEAACRANNNKNEISKPKAPTSSKPLIWNWSTNESKVDAQNYKRIFFPIQSSYKPASLSINQSRLRSFHNLQNPSNIYKIPGAYTYIHSLQEKEASKHARTREWVLPPCHRYIPWRCRWLSTEGTPCVLGWLCCCCCKFCTTFMPCATAAASSLTPAAARAQLWPDAWLLLLLLLLWCCCCCCWWWWSAVLFPTLPLLLLASSSSSSSSAKLGGAEERPWN